MMEKFKEVLYDIWQEACRHIEIHKSLPVISNILIKHIPLDQLAIMEIDKETGHLSTLAYGLPGALLPAKPLNDTEIKHLLQWHASDEILWQEQTVSQKGLHLLLYNQNHDFILAPLPGPADRYFYLYISAAKGIIEDRHIEMVRRVRQPLSTAVENDTRLREINALCEAAEADKNSLLAKLSRKQMGDTIIGENGGLKRVIQRVELVAASDVPVLIFGETGTGKELIARCIHNSSGRQSGPFIRVNCGAIPTELVDSQLFGHEKGSFTGAYESRKGWFERADQGTLFLDETGELPLQAQVRLLRVLQDGWIERVGGKQPIHVNVRIVLATHRDLASMVAQGTFREDLWYRIATFPIYLPPLRERNKDMNSLACHFARRSAIRFGLPEVNPTDKDIDLLTAYHWPGNIRELSSVIDRAALLGNGKSLEIAASLGWGEQKPVQTTGKVVQNNEIENSELLDEVIRKHISNILVKTRGRVEGPLGAAERLGLNPNTLRARMRKLHINRKDYQ